MSLNSFLRGLDVAVTSSKYPGLASPETQAANSALGECFIKGVLIKDVNRDGTINDGADTRDAVGVLFGLYHIWLRSTWEADTTIQRWAHQIMESGYALTDVNGIPNYYGRLIRGARTSYSGLILVLAILALASKTETGLHNEFHEHYTRLYSQYRYVLVVTRFFRLVTNSRGLDIAREILLALTNDAVYR